MLGGEPLSLRRARVSVVRGKAIGRQERHGCANAQAAVDFSSAHHDHAWRLLYLVLVDLPLVPAVNEIGEVHLVQAGIS